MCIWHGTTQKYILKPQCSNVELMIVPEQHELTKIFLEHKLGDLCQMLGLQLLG
jgi:hypothetical protein